MTSPADNRSLGAALTLLPTAPHDVWFAFYSGPNLVPWLDDSPMTKVPREDRRQLVIEIPVHDSIADLSLLSAALDVFRDQGVRLALTDVGAGYESLFRVLQLRPQFVTIHQSLIRGVAGDRVKRELVLAVVRIAREVGAQLTASGVDNKQDLHAVGELEVDQVQGDAVGHPTSSPTVWGRWPLAG